MPEERVMEMEWQISELKSNLKRLAMSVSRVSWSWQASAV
jgi:hypothetical protein